MTYDPAQRFAAFTPRKSYSYSFPELALDPGVEQTAKIDLHGVFRAQRLLLVGSWDVIRGHFKLKRSRLPLLNRDDVVNSYSKIVWYRRGAKIWYRKGRTTVEYRGDGARKGFTRTYLPSSVVYVAVEPLHFIQLRNVLIGTEPQMIGGGAPAEMFGVTALGNGLCMPTAHASVSILLKNIGDVLIRVRGAIFGYG